MDTKELTRVVKNVLRWVNTGSKEDLKESGEDLSKDYKKQIKAGVAGDGSKMTPVKNVTMNRQVRSTTPVIRKKVNSSKNPLVATKRAVGSIKSSKVGDKAIIEPSTPHGKLIFNYNANGAKTKRDPLVVSDIQEKVILEQFEKGLLKAIKL